MKKKRVRKERGAALLTAMLTVTLVATFAAASVWQQWRGVEVEAAERARVQAEWILTGGLDWARLVLREDTRSGNGAVDYLGEPWAVPLEEARLSSFLAADRNNTAETGPEVLDAFLSGQITDLQSLLNVNSLIDTSGKISEPQLQRFARLFELLGLPEDQLGSLTENLRFAADNSLDNRSRPMSPLWPQRIEDLAWAGLPAKTVAALRPFVSVLPIAPRGPDVKVNINTAPAEVIYAAIDGLSMADAQRLVAARERSPLRNTAEIRNAIGAADAQMPEGAVDWKSSFFEIQARLRLDQLAVQERSVVRRDGLFVYVLQRDRGPVPQPAPTQTSLRR